MAFFEDLQNTICFRKAKNTANFRWHYLFFENVIFVTIQITKQYIKRGFSRHRVKPKISLLVWTAPFWQGASSLFLSLFFWGGEGPKKKVISYSLRGFSSFVPPKGLSLKSFSSSYSLFSLVFLLFSFPFKNPYFSLFFVHEPLFVRHYFGMFLQFFFVLPFPLFMFACFIETDLSNIPIFKTNLRWFLVVFCSVAFVLLFSCFMFLLFWSLLALFLVCVLCYCVVFVSWFAFSLWKTWFSLAILLFLSHVG